MKTSFLGSLILVGALSLIVAPQAATAQPGQQQGQGGQGQQPPSAEELIKRMDTDKDGRLSKSEVKGPLSERFAEIDKDGDGYLTKAEVEAGKPSGPPPGR